MSKTAKQIVKTLLDDQDDEADVEHYLKDIPEPEVGLRSPIAPGDGVTASLRIVLHKSLHNGEWVTHMENTDAGGMISGHYFRKDYQAALADYRERCAKLHVDPDQSSEFLESSPAPEAAPKLYERGPRLKALKKGRTELSKQERKEVERRKAVWDDGHPGVWKSRVNGKTYYVCNTHRAMQVKPTLKGAIRAFDFIKTTS